MVAKSELGQHPPKDSLQAALEAYKNEPHTPELVTATWQAVWSDWRMRLAREGVSLELTVPDLDWDQDEIEKPTKAVNGEDVPTGMIYYPPEFSGEEGVRRLAVLFPQMKHTDLKYDLAMVHDQDETGWLNAETHRGDWVNVNTTEQNLREHFASQVRVGMNRHQYIILAEFMRPLGTNIDYHTDSRLLGTRNSEGGKVVRAGIRADNGTSLMVEGFVSIPNSPRYRDASLGGRLIRIKPVQKSR
ncbi:MAG TPA: hypothetical protein VM077_04410 [Candidatus Limnocylindrales bacterium]|nr:hypothetical protein [Candidatus Limnocylindrales bacterium]